jgi:hypothetical protein
MINACGGGCLNCDFRVIYLIFVNLPLPPPKEGNVCGDVETHGVRLCEECLRWRCASQCRDGARPVSTVIAGFIV